MPIKVATQRLVSVLLHGDVAEEEIPHAIIMVGHPQWWDQDNLGDIEMPMCHILAEGAIALSVTLSGGALFASWKLFQFPSSLIVKVILAIFSGASAQQVNTPSNVRVPSTM
jgi:hypothetical protein